MEGSELSTFITSVTAPMKEMITLENLGIIIAAGLGIAVTFVVGWFAFRWIYGKVKGGLKRGS